jgi:hypothetical protein
MQPAFRTSFAAVFAALAAASRMPAFRAHVLASVFGGNDTAQRRILMQPAFRADFTLVVAALFATFYVSTFAAQHDFGFRHAISA